MKIDRLYTLSQFVDYTNENIGHDPEALELIVRYNEFLKQPLKKEMFVNKIEMPESLKGFYETNPEGMKEEAKARDVWQEAEKKVIFEEIPTHYKIALKEWLFQEIKLSSLALYTNGQLKLKNVEI